MSKMRRIESMLSAAEVELQASETCNGEHVIHEIPAKNKKAKLDVREASLKAASAQIVVTNTLDEYARFVVVFPLIFVRLSVPQILEAIHRLLLRNQ